MLSYKIKKMNNNANKETKMQMQIVNVNYFYFLLFTKALKCYNSIKYDQIMNDINKQDLHSKKAALGTITITIKVLHKIFD